ncbi:hypothetical protein [Flavihumibacter sp. CACIAM 22H1]|uniref:hypothetical protein n=1 Tax=Flavihumibacter sp. CACIAM 22H1 TaxID=1812911 RepID=UPI000A565493|nr:hypothetical protein [Flavihumibacter sp. CACIAM 22H1]
MKIGLRISFPNNSLGGEEYYYLYKEVIKFVPFSFTKGYKGYKWNEKKHIGEIIKSLPNSSIALQDENGNLFSVGSTAGKNPHQSVLIVQDEKLFTPNENDILKILNLRKNLICAYLYNFEYTLVQSSSSKSLYTHLRIPNFILDSVKSTPHKIGIFGDKIYLTKFNAGRELMIGEAWLVSGWKMFFFEPFFNLVEKSKVLSFPYASKIQEIENGGVYVNLFDHIKESHTPDSMFRQWKWQEWIDFDNLENKYF